MALHQPPHHVGLARRAKRRARIRRALHLDQRVDDLPALHQQFVHGGVDAVDLAAQVGERHSILGASFGAGRLHGRY